MKSGVRFLSGHGVYSGIVAKKRVLLILMPVLCIVSLFFDIATGPAGLGLAEVFSSLLSPSTADPSTVVIVQTMRLPIALMALAVGTSLGLAGAVMQTILNNPLASPYTLGVGAGASFGASLAILFGAGFIPILGEYVISAYAFVFAMLVCLIIFFLGKVRGMSTNTMVLAGIALLFVFQALQAVLQYGASEGQLQSMVFWTFGSLQRSTWPTLMIVAGVLVVCLPLIMRRSWAYTTLLMGDEQAASMGINVDRLKLVSFVLISLLAAVSVSFAGTIGFIGLAGPHISRMLVGEDQRFYLPISALAGALVLSVASVISKSIIPGIIFPIGIITSIIGVPFFLILILRKKY